MRKHYTGQRIAMAIAICAVIALAVLNLVWVDGPEPDAEFPMANLNITWTYAKGAVKE